MAEYQGMNANKWQDMIKGWWNLTVAGLLIGTTVLGLAYVIFVITRKLKRSKGPRLLTSIPKPVARSLEDIRNKSEKLSIRKDLDKKPRTFGVYLGTFDSPPTPYQAQLLKQWEVVLLDPLQHGVMDAIKSECSSTHVLGRLDVGSIVKSERSTGNNEMIQSLVMVNQTILTSFKRPGDSKARFTGVVISNWMSHFPPIVFNELVKHIDSLGLNVYLEMSEPNFIPEDICLAINMSIIRGIVCRNGSILSNSEPRNYYQMSAFRPALEALAGKSSENDGFVMMWETHDDNATVDHAVIKRSYTWGRFTSCICWIGPRSALTNAEIAARRSVIEEPLGALMWLKEEETMKIHDIWKLNDKIQPHSNGDNTIYDTLHSIIPSLSQRLELYPSDKQESQNMSIMIDDFDSPSRTHQEQTNPFLFSAHGHSYTGLGCFQIGLDTTLDDFVDLVQQQRRLRGLKLLAPMKIEELHGIAGKLKVLLNGKSWSRSSDEYETVKELVDLMESTTGDENDSLRVFKGLNTGFHTTLETQFWGLYDADAFTGITDIYVSLKATDVASTMLHTFMSSRGFTRAQCLLAENALSKELGTIVDKFDLAPRLVHDIDLITPTENMLFLQRLVGSDIENDVIYGNLSKSIRTALEYQLMEVPTLLQLRALNSTNYIRGELSIEDMIASRFAWYREQGADHPDLRQSISVFQEVEQRVLTILMTRQADALAALENVLHKVLQKDQIDARADIFSLSVFSAFRKLAMNEVYLEVLDRNPLPNYHTDQAACFAEMFATGSQCQAYFDMSPNVLGKLLADRFRPYYHKNKPPIRDDACTELATSYFSKNIDLDPNATRPTVPFYYQVTFLGIFAIPAFLDIVLLTTLGRGLYLTTYMTETEKSMATTGLMVSLFLCGAIGTWISSGGSYYLHAMAFPAMNMFVLTRFIAGFAVCLATGFMAFIIIGVVKGFYAGLIFYLYYFVLMTYLSLLATLSIYQLPGFMFKSGRVTIMACIPILIISPIVTLWAHHDIVVYLIVLFVFLSALIYGARVTIAQWATWYLNIYSITDKELADWFMNSEHSKKTYPGLAKSVTDITTTPIPRQVINSEVMKEVNRRFWQKPTSDEVVRKLAEARNSTVFLMDWYCKYSRTKAPYPFSPTWNLQCKAAMDTLKDMQKGLKLHNAFIHWRHGGDEVVCGVLYFLIALLDKWVALVSGGSIVGLSNASSDEFRLSVGFGLAYYLIGAVALDTVAQPLWALANKNSPRPIGSLEALRQVKIADAKARRKLYLTNLGKFFFMHVWGLSVTAALMWSFNTSEAGTIMYLSYVGAYTGLLFYQYNRIYTGPLAMKDLIVAAFLGLLIGLLLIKLVPTFAYSSVVALAIGTWTAAILSVFTAKVGVPSFKPNPKNSVLHEPPKYFCSALENHPPMSQTGLIEIFDSLMSLSEELRYKLDPANHPGIEIAQKLASGGYQHNSRLVNSAFWSAEQVISQTLTLWRDGKTTVELVPSNHPNLTQIDVKLRSISRLSGDQLHIFVFIGLDFADDKWVMDIRRNCKVVAEALIQATSETRLGLSHDHSYMAEYLATDNDGDDRLFLPEGVKRQLESSSGDREKVIKNGDREVLKYLCLGIDSDIEWDDLPRIMRTFLLKRCLGERRYLSDEQLAWMRTRFCEKQSVDVEEYVARCNLGVAASFLLKTFAGAVEADPNHRDLIQAPDASYDNLGKLINMPISLPKDDPRKFKDTIKIPFTYIAQHFYSCTKLFVVSIVADPEFQRELDYLMHDKPAVIRWPVTFIFNLIWNFCKGLQQLIFPLFLLHGRDNIAKLYTNMKGIKTVIKKNRVVIESLGGPSTCFFTTGSDGSSELHQYSGTHDKQPTGKDKLMAINYYGKKLILRRREEYEKGALSNAFEYEYWYADGNSAQAQQQGKTPRSKLPMQRHCVEGKKQGETVNYDQRGYIESGSYMKDGNLVKFKFFYRKHAKFDDELLRAEFSLAHIQMKVAWSVPPKNSSRKQRKRLDKWIPHSTVTESTFIQGADTWHTKWHYEHKFHPEITTFLHDEEIETPDMILHDWFGVLKKPKNCSFGSDNPLLSFNSISTNIFSRLFGFNKQWYRVSTSRARTHLWKTWKSGKTIDAVTARWLDDISIRSDKIMKPYFRNRNWGRLDAAEKYLNDQTDTIMARVDIDPEISAWTPLAYKMSDLATFGQGGDSRINTRTHGAQLKDNPNELHVLAMDTGTWPNEGGGVSACRRDMVDNLESIRWHVIAESANDFGVPKFQIERNVQSLTILPLWGLDFLTPTHGIFHNALDSYVQKRSDDTIMPDIKKRFLPILKSLVRCSRATNFTHEHIAEASQALADLNTYFETSRHWSDVWKSDIVKDAWRELWLTEDMENTMPISEWFDAEHPTILHLDNALDMWQRYLFIFSIPVPEEIPDVFQASHHFAGASYGVLCKIKRNCTLHVWDHCISWREVTVFLSSAMSFDPPFVCNSLIAISRMASVLILHYADCVLPCADFFNPGWEIELGTQENTMGHRRTYARKIDPVVNGICNMERFQPIETIKTKVPTVVMLSHVRFVKDIKNAVLAADLIVNEWGIKDYKLEIYGDMERAPAYATECAEIIATKALRDNVILKGLGSPFKVLEDAWLFLNSSVSEGLPLAMGEAALTGTPVVCTDVGASFRVVTNMETGKKFSSVVAPNDAVSLARAQVKVLALLEEWSEFGEDPPGTEKPKLPLNPTKQDGANILKRMYEKVEQRRKLGFMGRANVLSSFSSDRYLQEHEQMLWIGKCQSPSYRGKVAMGLVREGGSAIMSSASSWMGKLETPGNFTPGNMSPMIRSGASTPDPNHPYSRMSRMSSRSSLHLNREGGTGTHTPTGMGFHYNLPSARHSSTVISSRASLIHKEK